MQRAFDYAKRRSHPTADVCISLVPGASSLTVAAMQRNQILNGLRSPAAQEIFEHGSLETIRLRQQIYSVDETIMHVYFPLDAVLSIVARMEDGSEIEIGTIGREGVTAFPLMLGASSATNECYCQVGGLAIKLRASLFRKLVASDRIFRERLDRYLHAYVNMLGQLAACNRLHTIYARCARWLLLTRDRVDADEFPLTQEFLAMMLGSDRSGVAIAAATLRRAGFISYKHGTIRILNRSGLEQAACECYGVARKQFDGMLRSIPEIINSE
jgi:CRP-like cAMP-binding protein